MCFKYKSDVEVKVIPLGKYQVDSRRIKYGQHLLEFVSSKNNWRVK